MNDITLIADTHCRTFDIEPTRLLIHAGDMCNMGSYDELSAQVEWLASLPAEHKVVIAGNHDHFCQACPDLARDLFEAHGITYLKDEAVEVLGYKVWGSPYSPTFGTWAFMESERALAKRFARISQDTDILIVHGPPHGIGDWVARGEHTGSTSLRREIERVSPKLTVHGHIHEAAGLYRRADGGLTVNASVGPRQGLVMVNGRPLRAVTVAPPVILTFDDLEGR